MSALYPVLIGLCVAAVLLRDGYELLKITDRIDPTDARVFATVFAAMLVMWVSWFVLGYVAPRSVTVPEALRWAGLVAVAAGAASVLGGMWSLRGVENIDHLVTTGLFSKVRHPMYLGFTLWILGWVAFAGTAANALIAPLALASIAWWRHLEEQELESRYGDAYAAYRATTWV